MIKKQFKIQDQDLNYTVGLNQITVTQNDIDLDRLLQITNILQTQFSDPIIQFFDSSNVLNTDHIFLAIYHTFKAFSEGTNISNRKNIEILLYLSCNRQIRVALETFGVKESHLKSGKLSYCIVTTRNNVEKINTEILRLLKAKERQLTFNDKSREKFLQIMKFFDISTHQILTILNSYDIENTQNLEKVSLDHLFLGLEDLIGEQMVLLSLENI
jgi:tRNA threonylcarbamoyladenosine modification (KEOPS) complex Cgi121 subunit